MTDIHIPGTSPVTRATYHGDDSNRNIVLRLMTRNPDADRDELEEMYLAKAKGTVDFSHHRKNEAIIDRGMRYEFTRHYNNIRSQSRPRRSRGGIPEAANAAAMEHVHIVLLDLIQPNGKKLRDCTGTECGEFGGWYIKLRDRVGSAIIGETISEAEVQRIFYARGSRS